MDKREEINYERRLTKLSYEEMATRLLKCKHTGFTKCHHAKNKEIDEHQIWFDAIKGGDSPEARKAYARVKHIKL
jgi:DNA-binding GntR family transcriptional regulator